MKRLTFSYEEKLTKHTATIRYGSQAMRRDLVDRLAQYENLGYAPEDLKLILDMTTIRYGSQETRRDLVERLAQYENLGYAPEDLKMILDMIIPEKMLESAKRIKEEQERSE